MNEKVKKGFKRCTTCGKDLKANSNNFYSDKATKDKLSNNCKDCQKGFASNYYFSNMEYCKGYITLKNKLKNNKISLNNFVNRIKCLKETYGIASNSRSFT